MEEFTDITFRVKTEHIPRLTEALASYFGYRPNDINGNPNPETKGAFVKRKIWAQWVSRTRAYEIANMAKPDPIEGGEV